MSRSETLVPDIALYLVARSPQPQKNLIFASIFCMGALYRVLNLTSDFDAKNLKCKVEFWQI